MRDRRVEHDRIGQAQTGRRSKLNPPTWSLDIDVDDLEGGTRAGGSGVERTDLGRTDQTFSERDRVKEDDAVGGRVVQFDG
ncbi:hypothetical protein BH23ACT9_BH23ACT9_34880 [soil metagenome]